MWVLEQMRANTMRDAAGLLAWRGYDNVRAEELARVARISVGTLYRHYGNKQGFAREVRQFTEQLLSRVAWDEYIRASLGDEPDYRCAFSAFWWQLTAFALGQPALFCFAFLHWHPEEDSPPQARGDAAPSPGPEDAPPQAPRGRAGYRLPGDVVHPARRGQAREVIRDVLAEGEREGALAPGAARVGETLVWGVLTQLARAAAQGEEVAEADVLAAEETLWRALAAREEDGPRGGGLPPSGGAEPEGPMHGGTPDVLAPDPERTVLADPMTEAELQARDTGGSTMASASSEVLPEGPGTAAESESEATLAGCSREDPAPDAIGVQRNGEDPALDACGVRRNGEDPAPDASGARRNGASQAPCRRGALSVGRSRLLGLCPAQRGCSRGRAASRRHIRLTQAGAVRAGRGANAPPACPGAQVAPRSAYTGLLWGAVPSVAWPSFTQYSMPPIISFTRKPSAASRAAALVEPLQPGPQQ